MPTSVDLLERLSSNSHHKPTCIIPYPSHKARRCPTPSLCLVMASSSSSSSPEIPSATCTETQQSRFSYKNATHEEVLEDLSRFNRFWTFFILISLFLPAGSFSTSQIMSLVHWSGYVFK